MITLTLMTTALFLTLRNMPMMADTGLRMVFFNLVTVFAFLVPIALVSAELATAWPKNGVFHWVE
ncbi:MAG: amino acid transporter, partial [Gammaproteobacteria bacterium]